MCWLWNRECTLMKRFVEPSSKAFEIDPFKNQINAILIYIDKAESSGYSLA